MQAQSINSIASPSGGQWSKKAHGATTIVSPGLQTYNRGPVVGPDAKLTLREQLYSVKNSMGKQLQFS